MKHPNTLSRIKTGLVVIDMQEKLAPVIPDFNEITHNVTKLVLACQMFRMPILVTEQYPQGLGPTVAKIKRGFNAFNPIEKISFAATDEPKFLEQLVQLKLESIIVCGVESHVCVNQTVLGLLQRGYKVHAVSDAIGTRKQLDHETALDKMKQAGAIPCTTEIALFELCEKAGTEVFKNIQRMVKSSVKKGDTITHMKTIRVEVPPFVPAPASAPLPPPRKTFIVEAVKPSQTIAAIKMEPKASHTTTTMPAIIDDADSAEETATIRVDVQKSVVQAVAEKAFEVSPEIAETVPDTVENLAELMSGGEIVREIPVEEDVEDATRNLDFSDIQTLLDKENNDNENQIIT